MKQTAVEFLISHLQKSKDWQRVLNEVSQMSTSKFDLIKEAKEMEKEQHQETFKQSRLAKIFEKDFPPVWESWEQYYNETFKSE